jgi:LAO/AO transport system kinase
VYQQLISSLKAGETRSIARAISLVENRSNGYESILEALAPNLHIPVVGFTGPPGAGKSSLVNSLVGYWAQRGLKVAVVAVDPASPFNLGSLLGDRLRMPGLFTLSNVYIRSMSSRGSLGGLCASVIEVVDVLKNAGFDRVVIETVGVGQSEVEIAGIADTTVVLTVPESGDDVQTLKSGVMEIADIFVVNKSDRAGANKFAQFLRELSHSKAQDIEIPVIETIATEEKGIDTLSEAIDAHVRSGSVSERRYMLLAEKIEQLVAARRMADFNKMEVAQALKTEMNKAGFNLYLYIKTFLTK